LNRKYIVILSVALFILGISILLYPAVSHQINQLHSSYAVQNMTDQVESSQKWQLDTELANAERYNTALLDSKSLDDEETSQLLDTYNNILNFGNGIMGTIRIPKIDLNLPIYHGVSEGILAKAVGHLPQSAFPVGGEGNHAVLTGHTGLPSAVLFTNLTQLEEDDRFYIQIADRSICYRVDQIKVVLPSQTEDLAAVKGKDYCTLVTCTPYGVNSHRLLIRGIRLEDQIYTDSEEIIDEMLDRKEASVSAIVMVSGMIFAILLTVRLVYKRRRG